MRLNLNTLFVLILLISLQHKSSHCTCLYEITLTEPVNANTVIFNFTNCSLNDSGSCDKDSSLELDCHDTEDSSLYPLEISDKIVLKTAGELDREQKETYNLRCFYFPVSDGGSNICHSFDFVLTIEDINDNGPVFSQDSYSIHMFETEISNFYNVKISDSPIVSDNDADINSDYTLTLNNSDLTPQDVFAVLPVTNQFGIHQIKNIRPIDREYKSSYNLTLVARDKLNPSLTSTAQLIIIITDMNDNAPSMSLASLKISIPEDTPIGSEVGGVTATDPDVYPNNQIKYYLSETCTYTSVSVDTLLRIDPDTGVLTLVKPIDADMPNIQTQIIQAVAVDPTDTQFDCTELEITITDINDNYPRIQILHRVESVVEESGEVQIALLEVSDVDEGENGRVDLNFSCDSFPNCNISFKSIKQPGGIYRFLLIQPLDYELRSEVIITFNFHDNGEIPKNGSLEFILPIDPINEFDPTFRSPTYSCTIRGDFAIGEPFCTDARATDLDRGTDGEITYSFLADTALPNIEVVREYFSVDESGSLVLRKEFDFEELSDSDTTYFFQLKASNTDSIRSSITNISVEVVNVNDNAPYFSGLSSEYFIREDASIGINVFSFQAIDIDSGLNGQVRVSILPSDTTEFEVVGSGDSWSLVTSAVLDRELKSIYNLSLVVEDRGEPSLSSEHNFSITLQDVNDNRPYFEFLIYSFTLAMGNDTWGIPVLDDDLEIIGEIRFDYSESPELESALTSDYYNRIIVLNNPSALSEGIYEFTVYVRDESLSPEENSARFILSYRPGVAEPPTATNQIAIIAGVGISFLLIIILIVIVAIICLTLFTIKRRVVDIRYEPQVQRRKKHPIVPNPSSILKTNARFPDYNNAKKVSFNSSVQLMTFNLPKVSSSETTSYTTSEVSNEEQNNQWPPTSNHNPGHFYSNDPESWLPSSRQVYQPPVHRHAASTSTSSELSQNPDTKDSNAPLMGHNEGYFPDTQEILISNSHAVYQNNYKSTMMGYDQRGLDSRNFHQLSPEEYNPKERSGMYDIGDIMPDIQDSETTDDSEKPPYGAVPIYISSDMTSEGELSAAMYSDNCTNISNQAEYCMTNIPSDSYDGEMTV